MDGLASSLNEGAGASSDAVLEIPETSQHVRATTPGAYSVLGSCGAQALDDDDDDDDLPPESDTCTPGVDGNVGDSEEHGKASPNKSPSTIRKPTIRLHASLLPKSKSSSSDSDHGDRIPPAVRPLTDEESEEEITSLNNQENVENTLLHDDTDVVHNHENEKMNEEAEGVVEMAPCPPPPPLALRSHTLSVDAPAIILPEESHSPPTNVTREGSEMTEPLPPPSVDTTGSNLFPFSKRGLDHEPNVIDEVEREPEPKPSKLDGPSADLSTTNAKEESSCALQQETQETEEKGRGKEKEEVESGKDGKDTNRGVQEAVVIPGEVADEKRKVLGASLGVPLSLAVQSSGPAMSELTTTPSAQTEQHGSPGEADDFLPPTALTRGAMVRTVTPGAFSMSTASVSSTGGQINPTEMASLQPNAASALHSTNAVVAELVDESAREAELRRLEDLNKSLREQLEAIGAAVTLPPPSLSRESSPQLTVVSAPVSPQQPVAATTPISVTLVAAPADLPEIPEEREPDSEDPEATSSREKKERPSRRALCPCLPVALVSIAAAAGVGTAVGIIASQSSSQVLKVESSSPTLLPTTAPSLTQSLPSSNVQHTIAPSKPMEKTSNPTISFFPSSPPTNEPTSSEPTRIPVSSPTHSPTGSPVERPTNDPVSPPTRRPTPNPTPRITRRPTRRPTFQPTRRPTRRPTIRPTPRPTSRPTRRPVTNKPTRRPVTNRPTPRPVTNRPSSQPIPPELKSFDNGSELRGAVLDYFNEEKGKEIIATYGFPMGSWDVSRVIDFSGLFYNNREFNEDISAWDTSRATSMNQMFEGAHAFNTDISMWDVSNVVDMSGMFRHTRKFRGNGIAAWNVGKVKDMSKMFEYALPFNQNLSPWDVSSVTDASFMFANILSFRRDLCAWGPKMLAKKPIVKSMFPGLPPGSFFQICPEPDDPDFSTTPPSPFCFKCTF